MAALATPPATLPAPPRLVAHRLGRAGGPDSSLRALDAALAGPATALETDVCLTADGRLALLHDPWLPMGTTADGWAHRTRWDGVLDRARLLDRDGENPTDQRVLRLEDLLERTPADLPLQLDVKVHGDSELAAATVRAVAARLRGRPDADRVEVLSFHSAACVAATRIGLRARLIVWADHEPDGIARWARAHDVGGVCVEHFLLDAAYVAQLRAGGLGVSTGTVNDPELARRVTALGVEAVTSDDPGRVAGAVLGGAALSSRAAPR